MKIVFCGDSWCHYMPTFTGQVGLAKHLSRILKQNVIDIGHPGDTTEETLSIDRRAELEKNIKNCDILCVSSGGDSIAGDQAVLWLKQNIGQGWENATDEEMMNNAINMVLGCYNDICLIRDEIAPNCKIISHVYDIPPKSVLGKGVLMFGPWLKPSLDYCGWTDPNDQYHIISRWLSQMASRIMEKSKSYNNWQVINTIRTLKPEDWANELHPTQKGFEKIAKLFASEIRLTLCNIN